MPVSKISISGFTPVSLKICSPILYMIRINNLSWILPYFFHQGLSQGKKPYHTFSDLNGRSSFRYAQIR